MSKYKKSILVIGFNTRPIVQSLYRIGLKIYVIDFFGDLDLYPYVEDSIIISKRINKNYFNLKDDYKSHLANFTIELLEKYPNIDYILIGSGLDDSFNERLLIKEKIKRRKSIIELHNSIETIVKARDILKIYGIIKKRGYHTPSTKILIDFDLNNDHIQYPFILKRKNSSGGINVNLINSKAQFIDKTNYIMTQNQEKEWLVQEYIDGINISSTIISNGKHVEIISINQQIIGLNFVNSPKEYMYCGNIVPANISKDEINDIIEISKFLSKFLRLRGINGFDFVVRDKIPYLMEINPRIPGSLQASENALKKNLLKLHIDSFFSDKWNSMKNCLNSKKKKKNFSTKLIFFSPKKKKQN
ncbi:MAG: ATP-grasp domain-containing protein [Candidatus Lokiarchaeota archaeon]|nr:ATP-grasp domain-containing protein [Candidatus Lokiarchaeota archaeon]